jgi:hypothetical protein
MTPERKQMIPNIKPIIDEVLTDEERQHVLDGLKNHKMAPSDVLEYVADIIRQRSPVMVTWNEKAVWTCQHCRKDNEVEPHTVQIWCRHCHKPRKFQLICPEGCMSVVDEREECAC